MSSAIRRAPLLSLLFTFGLLTPGCQIIIGIEDLREGPDGGSGPDDARGNDGRDATAEPGFEVQVRTLDATIPLDGKNVIDVEIRRFGGFTGEVTITAPNPPQGIVVTEIVVAGDQTSVQVELGAIGPLQIGDRVLFDLLAITDVGLMNPAQVNAEITDRPGAYDTTFGAQSTGYTAVSIGGDNGAFYDLDVLPGGAILALGWNVGSLGASNFVMTRLTSGGLVDPEFNGGTLVRTDFDSGSSGENARGYAVGRQVDGRIVAIGVHSAGASFPPDIALAQYTAAGGVGGVFFGNMSEARSRLDLGGDEEVTDGLVLADSTILAVGQSGPRLFVARAGAGGTLDTSFASPNGFHLLDLDGTSRAEAVITDAQDRILVAGFLENASRDMIVLRYTRDGTLDTTFAQGGIALLGSAAANERAVAIAVRPDGRIVVAGESNASGNLDFEVRQLLEDGTPDPSFGVQGVSTPAITDDNNEAEDMALLPDGRILMLGNSLPGGPIMARLTRDGALDPYFDQDGIFQVYLGDSGVARGLEVYSRSKVLVSGGDEGGSPGPGTFGVVVRMWM
jgi:uncharacterized delta-60 repeat protein